MTKTEMTTAIVEAKEKKRLSWLALADAVGLSPVFLTSACLGMNSMSREAAARLCSPTRAGGCAGVGLMLAGAPPPGGEPLAAFRGPAQSPSA